MTVADLHRYEEIRDTWTGELQGPPICADCSRETNEYVPWPCQIVERRQLCQRHRVDAQDGVCHVCGTGVE